MKNIDQSRTNARRSHRGKRKKAPNESQKKVQRQKEVEVEQRRRRQRPSLHSPLPQTASPNKNKKDESVVNFNIIKFMIKIKFNSFINIEHFIKK